MFFSSFDSVYRLCADVQYIYFMTDFLSVLEGEGHQQNGGQIRWRPSLVLKDSNWSKWLPLVVVGSGVQIAVNLVNWKMLIRLDAGGSIHNIYNVQGNRELISCHLTAQ